MFKFWDTYTVKARIAPLIITLFPLILISAIITPIGYLLGTITGSTVAVLSLSVLGAQFSRDRGKRKEKELWKSWGGAPTTSFLRLNNPESNQVRCLQIHKNLQVMLPDLKMPTPEEEKENPQKADEIYEAFVLHLKAKTRDTKKFSLVFKENINYGFLRNLWGLKPYGIAIASIGVVVSFAYLVWKYVYIKNISYEIMVIAIINLTLLLFWIIWVQPKRIKIAAIAYAERLFECCE